MIKIENLIIKYKEEIIAKNINLEIQKGDYILIQGENGSGKTSLIRSILNQNKYFEGSITIDGIKNTEIKNWSKIGYVLQKTNINHDIPLTVLEYLNLYTNDKEKINKLIEQNSLTHLISSKINDLSGGEVQKVNIIKELLKDIDYLFLDEPDSNLDKESKRKLFEHLEKLNKSKMTIIIVTHGENNIEGINKIYNIKKNKLERR